MESVSFDPEVGDLLIQLSALTGETPEQAVQKSVRERLDRLVSDDRAAYIARLRAIADRVASMPQLDPRSADEIIGYNEYGAFD